MLGSSDSVCKVTTTTGLYWSMIESGLGLLAACLPTLYSLVKKQFRSMTTEMANAGPSTEGDRSQQWHSSPFATQFQRRNDSSGSDIQILAGAGRQANIEAHTMKDMTAASNKSDPSKDHIWVKNTITRTEDMV